MEVYGVMAQLKANPHAHIEYKFSEIAFQQTPILFSY